ncbi:MAG: S53 family peptidase, partial [Sulfobacillus sp.]
MKRGWAVLSSAALLVVPIMLSSGSAAASQYGQLEGSTANALLRQSTNNGPADTSAQITLFVGFNFQVPSNMPTLSQYIQDTETPGNPYFHNFLNE